MSVVDCSKCGGLFLPASETIARDGARLCPACSALAKLIAGADALVKWHAAVDVTGPACEQLRGLIEQLHAAANEAKSL